AERDRISGLRRASRDREVAHLWRRDLSAARGLGVQTLERPSRAPQAVAVVDRTDARVALQEERQGGGPLADRHEHDGARVPAAGCRDLRAAGRPGVLAAATRQAFVRAGARAVGAVAEAVLRPRSRAFAPLRDAHRSD